MTSRTLHRRDLVIRLIAWSDEGYVELKVSMIRKKSRHTGQATESESSRLSPYPPPGAWALSSSAKDSEWEAGIFGDLTDKQTELFQQLLEVPRNSRGTIFFDSGGGSIYCGLALATLIKLRGLRAVGVVAGNVPRRRFCRLRRVSDDSSRPIRPCCFTRFVGKAKRRCGWKKRPSGPGTSSCWRPTWMDFWFVCWG